MCRHVYAQFARKEGPPLMWNALPQSPLSSPSPRPLSAHLLNVLCLSALCLSALCLSALWSPLAFAEGGLKRAAVQNRAPIDPYEWTLSAGLLPLDALKKGVTASGGLTLHYDHLWAWEAAHFTYSFPYSTALEEQLRPFKIEPTPFERVRSYVTSSVVFKPLYWKGAWLNQSLTYGELFFVAGGGYGWLTQTSRPVIDVGTGLKLFRGEGREQGDGWSARLDVRWLSFFNASDTHGELWVALGVSL
jgi:hypothetical protein